MTWERRDVVMTNWRDGSINFEQRGVEFPDFWSVNATNIVTTKYFRGAVGTPQRESSLRQLIDRVVLTYGAAGGEHGYFATEDDAEIFEHELTWMLLHQVFSFNSPVWFNVGTSSPQQVSACFILAVDDSMDSILDWYKEEGLIFKGGSGAGLNLSRIRSSKELLSSGGTASGPVSFMRGADASAGTIKSGGATRRAAKMVVLDVDHPDIEEFIETKAREEDKIRALRDAGFDMDLGGKDIVSVQYQNANNSVRVSDEFMRAVEDGAEFGLRGPLDGAVIETVDAKTLFRKIAQAAWECADPGIQYDDTINDWHTNPETGRITASNPCSEYMQPGQLLVQPGVAEPDEVPQAPTARSTSKNFVKAVELVITAMDISICFADFPTETIGETTRAYRQLGIGYANLGALLMATGHAYDSERRPAPGRGDHLADDRHRLPPLGRAGRRRRRRTTATPATPTPTSGSCASTPRPTTRSARSAPTTPTCSRPPPPQWQDVPRDRRRERLAQRAGLGARPDRHHRPHDGLRHHRHRAGPRAGQVQEAGRRRLDADRQPDGAAGAAQPGLPGGAGRGDRRVHRRARPRRRRPGPAPGALRGLRLRDGRAVHRARWATCG